MYVFRGRAAPASIARIAPSAAWPLPAAQRLLERLRLGRAAILEGELEDEAARRHVRLAVEERFRRAFAILDDQGSEPRQVRRAHHAGGAKAPGGGDESRRRQRRQLRQSGGARLIAGLREAAVGGGGERDSAGGGGFSPGRLRRRQRRQQQQEPAGERAFHCCAEAGRTSGTSWKT